MAIPIEVSPVAAFGLLLIGSGAVTLTADWRLALAATAGQYVAVALLLGTLASAPLAWLYVLVGGLACLILYLGRRAQETARSEAHVGAPFRAAALLLALLIAGVASTVWTLPFASEFISLACYTLAAVFVAQVALFREPMRVGVGLLSLLSGVALYAQSAEGSLLFTTWVAAAHLLASLATGYLQALWGQPDAAEENP